MTKPCPHALRCRIAQTTAGTTVRTFAYNPTVTAADTANDLIYVTQSLTFSTCVRCALFLLGWFSLLFF
jgi:hypothetical protein